MQNITFGYTIIRSELEQPAKAFEDRITALRELLNRRGAEELSARRINDDLPLVYLIASGGTEQAALESHEIRRRTHPDEAVYLLAHTGYNSLPAALEILAKLQQDGATGQVLLLQDDTEEEQVKALEAILLGRKVRQSLEQSHIGLIGPPSDWLVASSPDPGLVNKRWGPEIVPLSVASLREAMNDVDPQEVTAFTRDLEQRSIDIKEPGQGDLEKVSRIALALRKMVQDYDLTALTLRCFDLVMDDETTGCVALADLSDSGVMAGCEGDLVSTLGMLWAHELLGETPWMANPAIMDTNEDRIWLAHCTVPRSMVSQYSLRSHFESGLGVGIQGRLENGPVTLLRIGGVQLEKIWIEEGEILQAGRSESLCRTQVEIQLGDGVVNKVLEQPLGNHMILVRGHHAERLWQWWKTHIDRN